MTKKLWNGRKSNCAVGGKGMITKRGRLPGKSIGQHLVSEFPIVQRYLSLSRPAVPPPSSLPTLEAATSRLSLSLTQLTESHAKTTALMTSLADERQALEVKEKEMRSMVENAEEKRSWFNAFREWVETVATFLDEKVRSVSSVWRCTSIQRAASILLSKNWKMNSSHFSKSEEK